ncbi:MAG: Rne/Rng family ribonuclease, partial [Actinomycetota bacterium]|nr:Rne/Rng family ribonuclease [Actinomycetota bacterium]
GGRRRRKPAAGAVETEAVVPDEQIVEPDTADETPAGDDAEVTGEGGTRRRRRRRRRGEEGDTSPDDPANTVVRVREPRRTNDEITSVEGSTRLEAKKQRRREGRDASRRRVPIVSEAEFLARRESVTREMVVRQRADVMQIAVVEDGVLAEHYVARESQTSIIGNVFLGRVQNVLPSMEAAFIDIGKGRNAVLYAGEVDWKALGRDGKPRKIEDALKSGQPVLVQVTKDPVGHKGARLTSAISLPGRFLVYVPDGHTSGISRKLPDIERNRLKSLTKGLLPEDAGVIIRTAAEGATEEQLTRDVTGLTARWDDISAKAKGGRAPQLLYGEPDLMIKVVRDLFNEDFRRLVVDGDDAWDMIEAYVTHVAPDLRERLERWSPDEKNAADVFSAYRIDEQIAKALDRKVWLPSGGSLVIDRTEAMTVVDVNTGKFTGSGGNLEETVTRNNLEAADEMVRQLRLRDIGGIIVIDFIDMVLESNRDLVLRRLIECLGRDRTRHQVAEVTSLGLVQMTRKRIGTGLLEAFSSPCEHCQGRGLLMHTEPVEQRATSDDGPRYTKRRGKSDGTASDGAASDGTASDGTASDAAIVEPSPQLAGK